MKSWLLSICFVLASVLGGCVEPIPDPPHNLAEYELLLHTHPQQYPTHTVVWVNLQRVLDEDLGEIERLESLELATGLSGNDNELADHLASVLSGDRCPPRLHKSILTYMVERGRAGVTPRALARLSETKPGPRRTAMLKHLAANSVPEALEDLLKLWAAAGVDGPDEGLFRRAVAKAGGAGWVDTVLRALNADGFRARGSALAVLSARVPRKDLAARIIRMTPGTPAVRAIRTFIDRFDYIPANGQELLACVSLWSGSQQMLDRAAGLSARWGRDYNYSFNVRDFHLLSRLAGDPLRKRPSRRKLVGALGKVLMRRKHLAGAGGQFLKPVERLGPADLWNLTLLNEMLQRPRVQLALRILADRLRARLISPRSGLVFYENGRAMAKLYPQSTDETRGDREYVPSRSIQRAGRHALCHFHTRFETIYNGDRAAPAKRELEVARELNFHGLMLVSIDTGTFSAFYYNPDGAAVSLGLFPFGK